ncbi:hypothetical protein TRIUR3_00650 [Triticum urartu]|uniref:Uncharacterized protein n=1 Tax=Triticum urartu TaxID=4572 RepID=M8AE67_TRIUA|nr:hypothetical protein TRIUR3_00650 [Triticum urartu]
MFLPLLFLVILLLFGSTLWPYVGSTQSSQCHEDHPEVIPSRPYNHLGLDEQPVGIILLEHTVFEEKPVRLRQDGHNRQMLNYFGANPVYLE